MDELPATLPRLNSALRVGTRVQARMPQLNEPLQGAFNALDELVKQPTTNGALRGLTDTVGTLQPTLRYVGPFVTVCNNWNYFWTLAAEHQSAPDASGSAQRVLLNMAGTQQPGTDSVGSAGANEFAHGKGAVGASAPEYLHGNYYGPAVNSKGEANCGAGQTGYVASANPYRDTSIPGDPYKNTVVETGQFIKDFNSHPELSGPKPLYAQLDRNGKGIGLGPTRLPPGETFTTGPGGRGADIARP